MTGKKDVEQAKAAAARMKQAYDMMYAVMKEQRAALLFLIDGLVSIHDSKSQPEREVLEEVWVPKARQTLELMRTLERKERTIQ